MIKFYPNTCQQCYKVVKLYDVVAGIGGVREMGTCKVVRGGGGGDGLSQHGRETQDGEVQRWVYELESQIEQRQLFNEGDMGQGDRCTKGQVRGHKHGRPQKFS